MVSIRRLRSFCPEILITIFTYCCRREINIVACPLNHVLSRPSLPVLPLLPNLSTVSPKQTTSCPLPSIPKTNPPSSPNPNLKPNSLLYFQNPPSTPIHQNSTKKKKKETLYPLSTHKLLSIHCILLLKSKNELTGSVVLKQIEPNGQINVSVNPQDLEDIKSREKAYVEILACLVEAVKEEEWCLNTTLRLLYI